MSAELESNIVFFVESNRSFVYILLFNPALDDL